MPPIYCNSSPLLGKNVSSLSTLQYICNPSAEGVIRTVAPFRSCPTLSHGRGVLYVPYFYHLLTTTVHTRVVSLVIRSLPETVARFSLSLAGGLVNCGCVSDAPAYYYHCFVARILPVDRHSLTQGRGRGRSVGGGGNRVEHQILGLCHVRSMFVMSFSSRYGRRAGARRPPTGSYFPLAVSTTNSTPFFASSPFRRQRPRSQSLSLPPVLPRHPLLLGGPPLLASSLLLVLAGGRRRKGKHSWRVPLQVSFAPPLADEAWSM